MMNWNHVRALTVNGRSFSENAQEAGIVTLQGMLTIFAVLALLWLVIEILHSVLAKDSKAVKNAKPEPQKSVAKREPPQKPVSEAVQPVPAASVADDGALIAAITAAVAAAMADDGYTGGFRVVSFKRSSDRRNGRG